MLVWACFGGFSHFLKIVLPHHPWKKTLLNHCMMFLTHRIAGLCLRHPRYASFWKSPENHFYPYFSKALYLLFPLKKKFHFFVDHPTRKFLLNLEHVLICSSKFLKLFHHCYCWILLAIDKYIWVIASRSFGLDYGVSLGNCWNRCMLRYSYSPSVVWMVLWWWVRFGGYRYFVGSKADCPLWGRMLHELQHPSFLVPWIILSLRFCYP